MRYITKEKGMKHHIIYNPAAQGGGSRAVLDKVCARLKEAGREYEVHETMYRGHARDIAAGLPAGEEELIVVGGDGTFHEVLNGLAAPEKMRIALIPAGTGNDFCVAADSSFDPDAAMAPVLRGDVKPVDYIDFSGKRCLNAGGMGMDVDVLERCARGSAKGRLKYLRSLIASLFAFRGCDVRLSVNGKVYSEKALLAAVCNGDRIGGGIRICPQAKVDDGKLEVVLVPQLKFSGMVRAFIALMRGKILSFPQTLHFYCEEAEIFPDRARTVQLDGELYKDCRVLDAKVVHGLQIYR